MWEDIHLEIHSTFVLRKELRQGRIITRKRIVQHPLEQWTLRGPCWYRPCNVWATRQQWKQTKHWMELVRICHGAAQHVMKSRVRAYKNCEEGSGWQANWREHFCHSLTLKTSFFPLSIRFLFGPITNPTIKKSTSVTDLDSNQEVGGRAKASGFRKLEWWSSGKKALRTDSSLFRTHRVAAVFALWVFTW